MSRERLANAFDKAAEAMAELVLELRASDSPSREAAAQEAGSAPPAPAARAAGAVPPAPAASALGKCPIHDVAWTVKQAGISKNGKPYPAFWKCSERDEDGYCKERPTAAWANSHPIQMVAA